MKHFLRHYLLPHHTNNHRPKLLHNDTLLLVAVFFLSATLLLTGVKKTHPQVLGTSINISTQELLHLTNEQRQKNGFSPLVMNDQLTQAAQLKARDMFAKNYWAHNSPTGEMPWDFIKNAGYNYEYAGENLARGFTSAHDVVIAWMNSPEHRENLLSPNYHDVGFALQEGPLTGEKDTILIVQELGSTPEEVPSLQRSEKTLGSDNQQEVAPVAIESNPTIDSKSWTKNIGLLVLMVFIIGFIVDIIIIRRQNIVRFVGHNLDHIFFLLTVGWCVFLLQFGSIL